MGKTSNIMSKIFTVISFLILLMAAFGCGDLDENHIDSAHVVVDFSVPKENVKSMSGFLHGINYDKPDDSLIHLLEPKLFRSGARFYDAYARRSKLNARQILVISGLWATGPGRNFSVMPYSDYDLYKKFLKAALDSVGNNVIFDMWNEPDVGHLWTGTQQQFFEFFKITHDIIRAKYGDQAIITGPSSHFLPEYIQDFMIFCDTANIQLDIFSYHELYEKDYASVQNNLKYIRRNFVENPRFRNVGIKEVHVNEYGYDGFQLNPSLVLGYLHSLEQGEADGACRACWNDLNNKSTCWNGTLGGLLTHDDHKPRAAWWAHKLYAESVAGRVQSFSNMDFVANFAYIPPQQKEEACIILSNSSRDKYIEDMEVTVKNISSLPFIKDKDLSLIIKVYKIPETEKAPLEDIELVEQGLHTIENDNIRLTFHSVDPLSNYVLKISRNPEL